MGSKVATTYGGSIDWVEVYRQHYSIDSIEARLASYLVGHPDILFAGFGEVANRLAQNHDVHYVEFSASMIDQARSQFKRIARTTHGDILEEVKHFPSAAVLVTCRISAYWHRDSDLPQFLDQVRLNNAQLIIVDFFDKDKMESTPTLGDICFSKSSSNGNTTQRDSTSVDALPTLVTVSGAYVCSGSRYTFEETRAYYSKPGVLKAARELLPDHQVCIESPIVDGDPGFTLVVRAKEHV